MGDGIPVPKTSDTPYSPPNDPRAVTGFFGFDHQSEVDREFAALAGTNGGATVDGATPSRCHSASRAASCTVPALGGAVRGLPGPMPED